MTGFLTSAVTETRAARSRDSFSDGCVGLQFDGTLTGFPSLQLCVSSPGLHDRFVLCPVRSELCCANLRQSRLP